MPECALVTHLAAVCPVEETALSHALLLGFGLNRLLLLLLRLGLGIRRRGRSSYVLERALVAELAAFGPVEEAALVRAPLLLLCLVRVPGFVKVRAFVALATTRLSVEKAAGAVGFSFNFHRVHGETKVIKLRPWQSREQGEIKHWDLCCRGNQRKNSVVLQKSKHTKSNFRGWIVNFDAEKQTTERIRKKDAKALG
jgi:hypothetical protein